MKVRNVTVREVKDGYFVTTDTTGVVKVVERDCMYAIETDEVIVLYDITDDNFETDDPDLVYERRERYLGYLDKETGLNAYMACIEVRNKRTGEILTAVGIEYEGASALYVSEDE